MSKKYIIIIIRGTASPKPLWCEIHLLIFVAALTASKGGSVFSVVWMMKGGGWSTASEDIYNAILFGILEYVLC